MHAVQGTWGDDDGRDGGAHRAEPTVPIYCPSCEAANRPDAVACNLCGHELSPVSATVVSARSARRPKTSRDVFDQLRKPDAKFQAKIGREVDLLWTGGALLRVLGEVALVIGVTMLALAVFAPNAEPLAWVLGLYSSGAGVGCVLLGTAYRALGGIWAALLRDRRSGD